MEIEELKRQRDLAQSQVDELRRKLEEDQQVSLLVLADNAFLLNNISRSLRSGNSNIHFYFSGFQPN